MELLRLKFRSRVEYAKAQSTKRGPLSSTRYGEGFEALSEDQQQHPGHAGTQKSFQWQWPAAWLGVHKISMYPGAGARNPGGPGCPVFNAAIFWQPGDGMLSCTL